MTNLTDVQISGAISCGLVDWVGCCWHADSSSPTADAITRFFNMYFPLVSPLLSRAGLCLLRKPARQPLVRLLQDR